MPALHHELVHALQAQSNCYTRQGELCEIEAHLHHIKFVYEAIQHGIIEFDKLPLSMQTDTLAYEKYNGDDAAFILHYIHPLLVWSNVYKSKCEHKQNPEKNLLRYAHQWGLSGQDAKKFVKGLQSNDIEHIYYGVNNHGNLFEVKESGNRNGVQKMIITTHKEDAVIIREYAVSGKEVQKIKTRREEKSGCITETFYENGKKTEKIEIIGNTKIHTIIGNLGNKVITDSMDEDHNICRTIVDDTHTHFMGQITQNFIGGKLVSESKIPLKVGVSESKNNTESNDLKISTLKGKTNTITPKADVQGQLYRNQSELEMQN